MNNTELEQKIKEIITINNYFDMIIATKNFEKEYKTSDFFKITKKPLVEVVKEAKLYYITQVEGLQQRVQNFIDNLNFDKVVEIMNQLSNVLEKENTDILNALDIFKDLNADIDSKKN